VGIPRAMGERREKEAGARWSGMVALRQHPRTHRLDSSGGTCSPMFAAAGGRGRLVRRPAASLLLDWRGGTRNELGRRTEGGVGGDDEATGGGVWCMDDGSIHDSPERKVR
jgi:hypothetical protein